MTTSAVMNFMKQQGFAPEAPDRAALRFRGLLVGGSGSIATSFRNGAR